ncbi:Tetranectin [Dissostichus eleginoides]|uniref:Tetranectin n=1 Tax=Dissostichus eleginoides TaxID=100907 RepID=A0AAD9BCG8_DISEL|nr:Tetranectin [Dissostichus eleginoides]
MNVLVFLVESDTAKHSAIEKLQKQKLNLLKEQQALQAVCLKGAKINNKCFLSETVRKSYHTASEDCNALGGVLGTPTSSDDNDKLTDYIRQSIGPEEQVWLGLNDVVTEGRLVYQTGSSITYKNWDTSNSRSPQPDGAQSHNCAIPSRTSRGKWFDENAGGEALCLPVQHCLIA